MAFVFKGKDVTQKIAVKFTQAFLPDAKKQFYLRPAHRQELGIEEIAAKASIYKINTDPEVIIEGYNAATELIFYLVANGYRVKTSLCNAYVGFSGEYDGSETHLAEGVYPSVRVQPSALFRDYIRKMVNVIFDGILVSDGLIAEAVDEATGLVDEAVTRGNILTIRGYGLKIELSDLFKERGGFYFRPVDGGERIKADIIAVNEPRTLKVVVPANLVPGTAYRIEIVTQSSVRSSHHLLKDTREVLSDFTVTAQ